MTNVLIVDDHPVVVEGLRKIFCESNGLFSCTIAFTASECKKALKAITPDIVMLDINLPDGSGIDLCKEIHDTYPKCKILAISSFSERSYIQRMLENGANGYLLKNSAEEEIMEAVNDVLKGKTHLSYEINEIIEKSKNQEQILVTRREHEVLQMIADGLTNQEIADKMFISPLTVDSHRKNLLLKLDAKNTAALVKKGITLGLIN